MKYAILIALAFSSASCFAKDHLIFSCTNKQNKVVEVRRIGNDIQYSFGKIGKPELVFKNTKAQVTRQTKADPSLSTHSEWVVLKNGAFSYLPRIAFGQPDRKGNVESEAGVWIKRNGELLSSEIVCDKSKGKIFANFEPDLNYMKN